MFWLRNKINIMNVVDENYLLGQLVNVQNIPASKMLQTTLRCGQNQYITKNNAFHHPKSSTKVFDG